MKAAPQFLLLVSAAVMFPASAVMVETTNEMLTRIVNEASDLLSEKIELEIMPDVDAVKDLTKKLTALQWHTLTSVVGADQSTASPYAIFYNDNTGQNQLVDKMRDACGTRCESI
mmetsp:Transcript_6942/g.16881  ORF Transcript_6942/g.16881 Transcript_6942/m.16881 type:complete len:115 (-) Transcript_6942:543-887(-)